jgi:RNA polymerase subunit RPABC4/transcription elongation factor Spt4
VYDESSSSPVSFDVVFPTFLEQYGLTWLVDYALYVWIIVGIIAALIILAVYAYKRQQPPPEETPVKAGLPAKPGERLVTMLPKERAELPTTERAVERITERPSERIVERVVERPVPEIKKGKKAPSLILPRRKCANCEKVISTQAKFCDKCRAPQPEKVTKKYEAPPLILPRVYCYNCGAIISEKAKFCDKCKAPQKN